MSKVSVIIPVYNVENYIRNMLESLRNQSFRDFEAVIVNDGSTDNSLKVIEEFCKADNRFKCFTQENGGVAAARNKGIDLATGEYAVFYDPDDYIPPHALEKMYKTAASERADMVIGVMEEKSLGESLIYMHSQKLAKQKRISPLDRHFFGAWSLCHKMFSLEFIKKNNLRVEALSNAEDGVFTFCALNYAEKICGCDAVAYNYLKRPFWLTPSATQIISSKYLEGLLASHDRILEEASKLADKYLTEEEKEVYLQPLYVRFIEGEMINGYYRGIWRAEENLTDRLTERTKLYRSHITDKQWQELLNRHKDLKFEQGFLAPAELAKQPSVSFIIERGLTAEKLNMVLGSMYNQLFPRFEVLLYSPDAEKADAAYRSRANLRIIDENLSLGEAMETSKGKYVLIVDELAMFTKNSVKLMAGKLESDSRLGFVSMLMKQFDGNDYKELPALSASYGYGRRARRRFTKQAEYDSFFVNKLFRKSAIEGFCFSGDLKKDVVRLYRSLPFAKLRKGAMITDLSEEDILSRAQRAASPITIKWNHAVNSGIEHMIQRAKRHITREDIDSLKKKIGK